MGALLCAVALGGLGYALIEQVHYGWHSPQIYVLFIVGIATFTGFIWHEKQTDHPMLPLSLFKARNFSVGNSATVVIYAALSIATFLITVYVQQVAGYSAIRAGLTFLPVTVISFFLAPRFGALADKYGSKFFVSFGPLLSAAGFLSMLRVGQPLHYVSELLPGVVIFGLGLSMTVAPLTSSILGAINSAEAGIASAVNNAVSRIAGLIGIAVIGLVTGPTLTLHGFHRGLILVTALFIIGGIVLAVGSRSRGVEAAS
jgi:predicted MFS family arabinose efflux permease